MPKPHRLIAIALVAILAGAALFATLVAAAEARETRRPCPARQRFVPPVEMHLEPGLVEHQNWLVFNVPERYRAQHFVLCYDGQVHESGPGSRETAELRVYVETRWVNLAWLSGRLDEYRQPGHWSIGYDVRPARRPA
jgi:hypothetical protein